MSGKCKDGVYGMLTMDLIIIDKITSTGKDVNRKASGRMHIFWGREFE
jgi:hypothetical protein